MSSSAVDAPSGLRMRRPSGKLRASDDLRSELEPPSCSTERDRADSETVNVDGVRHAKFEPDVTDDGTASTSASQPTHTRNTSGREGGRPSGGFLSFMLGELTAGYALSNDSQRYKEKRRKVYAFVQVPRELEKFLLYGFLQCADAFLYFFTLLPIRLLLCIFQLMTYPFTRSGLSPSQMCDLMRCAILVSTTFLLQYVDTSVVYHLVRGQAVIKLYIMYNMLEVADRLLSSIGQDIVDALYWTVTEPTSSRRYLPWFGTLPHLLLAIAYTAIHTLLIIFQATTLNVAFNSHNKALLTIMISNNFVELKGSVFKKFAKSNLFQMACSDVRERFHYAILLTFVVVRNLTAVNWAWDHLLEMLPDMALVIGGELVVDWFKHAFITKFNEIPYQVYKDFTVTIAYDAVRSRRPDAFSDHADQVSRRMGFVPLPLTCLVIRIVMQTVKTWDRMTVILLLMTYAALVSIKAVNSVLLLGRACRYVATYESMQQEQAELLSRLKGRKAKSKSVPSSPKLSLLEFNDVLTQNANAIRGLTMSDLLAQADAETPYSKANTPEQRSPRQMSDVPVGILFPSDTLQETPKRGATRLPRSRSMLLMTEEKEEKAEVRRVSPTKKTLPTLLSPIMDDSSLAEDSADVLTVDSSMTAVDPAEVFAAAGELPSPGSASGDAPLVPPVSSGSPHKRTKLHSECESLAAVDRYTLLNDDRIEM